MSIERNLLNFLSETDSLMKNLDEIPHSPAVELYNLMDGIAKNATFNIKKINPEIRVVICARQDKVLDRILDTLPPEHFLSYKAAGVYTPSVQGYRRWKNAELLKDKGLTGYMLAETINATSTMYFGTKEEDYPYLKLLPNFNMLYNQENPGNPDPFYEHLQTEYKKMDIVILNGRYSYTENFLELYRELRPDGKVYCGLDMNSDWMEKIDWSSEATQRFAGQCDVIATSCTYLMDKLNHNPNVNFPCRFLSNGFFNATGDKVVADAKKKKNVILTVGRLGTAQKNNAELLVGFAKAADALPNWSVRLVGSIEPDFQNFVNEYHAAFPYLKDRVILTGPITDKKQLYKEYSEAKIFALTSQFEGGPNVFAEALVHGCKFITSDIDAADDIIGFGELGLKYTLKDTNALANGLIELANNCTEQEMESHIPKALRYANKHFDATRNAEKLAYMLYNKKSHRALSPDGITLKPSTLQAFVQIPPKRGR